MDGAAVLVLVVLIILLIVVASIVYRRGGLGASRARRPAPSVSTGAGAAPKTGGADVDPPPPPAPPPRPAPLIPRTFWGAPDWRQVPWVDDILAVPELAARYRADLFREMRSPLSARDLRRIYDTQIEVTTPDGLPTGRTTTLREVAEREGAEYGGRIVRDAWGRLQLVELVRGTEAERFTGEASRRVRAKPAHYYFHTHPRDAGAYSIFPTYMDYWAMSENTATFPSIDMVVSKYGVVKYGPREQRAEEIAWWAAEEPVRQFYAFDLFYGVALLHAAITSTSQRPLSLNKYRKMLKDYGVDFEAKVAPAFVQKMSALYRRNLSYSTVYDVHIPRPEDKAGVVAIPDAELKEIVDEWWQRQQLP